MHLRSKLEGISEQWTVVSLFFEFIHVFIGDPVLTAPPFLLLV